MRQHEWEWVKTTPSENVIEKQFKNSWKWNSPQHWKFSKNRPSLCMFCISLRILSVSKHINFSLVFRNENSISWVGVRVKGRLTLFLPCAGRKGKGWRMWTSEMERGRVVNGILKKEQRREDENLWYFKYTHVYLMEVVGIHFAIKPKHSIHRIRLSISFSFHKFLYSESTVVWCSPSTRSLIPYMRSKSNEWDSERGTKLLEALKFYSTQRNTTNFLSLEIVVVFIFVVDVRS